MYLLSTFGISVVWWVCLCHGEMAKCDSFRIWYHHHCMDIPSKLFGESEVHWEYKRCMWIHSPSLYHWQVSTVCDSDSNCLQEVSPRYYIATNITDKKLICRFGVIREVATICVCNFLLTEGKVHKFMFIPVLFWFFLLKHFHQIIVHTPTSELTRGSICVM